MGQFRGIGLPFFGCFTLLAGNIFLILGFASPYWLSEEGSPAASRGLWRERRCQISGGCYLYDIVKHYGTYFDAVRGLMCLAIIFLATPLVVLPIYMYVAGEHFYRRTMTSAAVLALLSALCIFISVIVFASLASEKSNYLDWSFYMIVVSGALATFSFIVFLVAALTGRPVTGQLITNAIYVDNMEKKSYFSEKMDN